MKKLLFLSIGFALLIGCDDGAKNKEKDKLKSENTEPKNSDRTTESNKLSFIENFAGTSWTNGTDTIFFKKLEGEVSNWSDVVGPEMWYLYSVDGPFFVLPCEE